MTTSTATLNLDEVAEFWRIARRLYSVYIELDRTFELDIPSCPELEDAADSPDPDARERVLHWFEQIDGHVQVWQLRQLLQSTSLQNEENLRYLIARHLDKKQKTEADKDKIDFLLVQYFAHCAPHGPAETALEDVARVLEPAMGKAPQTFPDWAPSLDAKLRKLNESNSLEELQNSGALQEVRELKLAVGDEYFEPGFLVAFTRFNFLARRAFFRAMHLDLHAIRESVNELERLGFATVDCRDAGLTESESLEQVRHVVHQWKTPFRAPYSGGSSFLQLILLRHALQRTLEDARPGADAPAPTPQAADEPVITHAEESILPISAPAQQPEVEAASVSITEEKEPVASAEAEPLDLISRPASNSGEESSAPSAEEQAEEEDYLMRCVADIAEQLKSVPAKNFPAVSAIVLGGCKLLIATWEAQAFVQGDETAKALQRTVAARTILHVCLERHKKNEPTDLGAAMDIARSQVNEMKSHVEAAKEAKDIDAAVNLAATTKRLLSLIAECEKAG
ncbi:MAG TPA: hypothetical protein VNZ47_14890 [Candidatus Dormibacteraeota bacterium]|jgi:hypothetical protein|nr:hypothetical protein [Candidatus Dormibacteraeota bacterium]